MNSTNFDSQSLQFSLKNMIPKKLIDYLCSDCMRFREFDPSSTLYCFIFQVLNRCSAKTTLLNFNVRKIENKLKPSSMNTSAYTKAKQRLCEIKLKTIASKLGKKLSKESNEWKYKGRSVFLGDGTVINLEDTKDIRKSFPIATRLGRQWGRPKMRLLTFFDLSSGAFIDGEIGSFCGKGQAETSLLKKMLSRIEKNSILVLDKFFTNYYLREELENSKIDYVIRARDKYAKRTLKRKSDLEIDEFEPGKLKGKTKRARYIKSTIKRKGFRVATIYIVTNLLKENGHTKEEIEYLYLQRWGVEVDIRNLKETLEANKLRSKSSSLVRKEVWVNLIAYNIVKSLSNKSCHLNLQSPRKQAFKIYVEGALMLLTGRLKNYELDIFRLLKGETLNARYRREPRVIRFVGKKYEEMKMSRKEARKLKWGKSGRRERQGLQSLEAA
jgi:hypothetical protein